MTAGNGQDHAITTIEGLQKIYGEVYPPAKAKETDRITLQYRKLIEAAPFVAIATGAPEGLDCSPKGDAPGFVRILDERTLAIPDRPGNNRIDGFRNIVRDPRIALLFLIPGVGETLRVNGRASIDERDPLLAELIGAQLVVRVEVEAAFPNCPRYIHKMQPVETSPYAPAEGHTPPVPEWKTRPHFREVLPPSDPACSAGA